MGLTRLVDRAPRGDERLREHLPTEHPAGPDVSVATTVDVDLERFEIEKVEEIGERDRHGIENRESGIGNRESGIGRRATGDGRRHCWLRAND